MGTTAMAFTSLHLYFDDVQVGQEWESPAQTLTEADIVNFAGLSGDFNPIHTDHEFARATPFRRPIAHGLLVLSVASGLGQYAPPMRTVAFVQIRDWHLRFAEFDWRDSKIVEDIRDQRIRNGTWTLTVSAASIAATDPPAVTAATAVGLFAVIKVATPNPSTVPSGLGLTCALYQNGTPVPTPTPAPLLPCTWVHPIAVATTYTYTATVMQVNGITSPPSTPVTGP